MLRRSLVPQHGASSGCGWKNLPPDLKGSCEYVVMDRREGAVLQIFTKCSTGPRNWQGLVKMVVNHRFT
jgi:hypothetical protein